MAETLQWLISSKSAKSPIAGGVISVISYSRSHCQPEEVVVMEKAKHYGAEAVFFEARRGGQPAVPQAFIYRSQGPGTREEFASLHKRLWSWGGVPLVYRVTPGLIELFRCAHRPDFDNKGDVAYRPFAEFNLLAEISSDPWWREEGLRNGTIWDDKEVCEQLLSSDRAAQKTLISAVKDLYRDVEANSRLFHSLRRRLLILSILIAYLEARGVFEDGFFDKFLPGASRFFEVLADGPALVKLLEHLEQRFNGHIFTLKDDEREKLRNTNRLARFAEVIEGRQEKSGQRTLWQRYSFADLPIELISHVYQLFVEDSSVAVYTPHFLVRLMLGEVLSFDRLDRLVKGDEVILDGACGSGIFLVEAYKRLILHWRSRNDWEHPTESDLRAILTKHIRGIDLEEGAVELSAFSLCLALCDALEPEEIRKSVSLFPVLKETAILTGCFFEKIEQNELQDKIGIVVGNPPFASRISTEGGQRALGRYRKQFGSLPDKQIALLFLHESMRVLEPMGTLCLLQSYSILYNQLTSEFRKRFIERWDVREFLDFISVGGLFQQSGANVNVVVVIAEAQEAPARRKILHATFRRSGRVQAKQGFDIDYYDLNWVPREIALTDDLVWRSNLLGGGRVLGFAKRLKQFRSLEQFADEQGWDIGEGFIKGGSRPARKPASHVVGMPVISTESVRGNGSIPIVESMVPNGPIEEPRSEKRFTPPLLLIREQMDIPHNLWNSGYVTYGHQIVGVAAAKADWNDLKDVSDWLDSNSTALKAYIAATSTRLFSQKNTSISGFDVHSLPYPEDGSLGLSSHEEIIASDIVDYYRDLIRLGENSVAMKEPGVPALRDFNALFTARINGIYTKKKVRALKHFEWPGIICQPFVFGKGEVAWKDSEKLKDRVDKLLKEQRGGGLNVTRVTRLYGGSYIFFIKPNRLRYWLKSIALRDSDEVLADLAQQGF